MDPQGQNERVRKMGSLVLDEVRDPWTEIALKYQGLITLTTSIITDRPHDHEAGEGTEGIQGRHRRVTSAKK
jgi:hypothetical protein